MSSSVEGVCTIKINKVSELLKHDKANSKLYNSRSYDGIYYVTYGPFTVGESKWDIRVFSCNESLSFNLCFIENAEAFNKYGYTLQLQDHNSNSNWIIHSSIILNQEKSFSFLDSFIKASGLPSMDLSCICFRDLQKYSRDDYMVVKITFWVLLGDSKVVPPKLVQQQLKHNQPNCPHPDFISKLLVDQFADIQFIVRDQTFSAHRAILAARSSVFQSKLLSLQEETCWNKLYISVQHMDALTFKYLLHFIYTNSLPSDFETTTRGYHLMFIAAHRFKIEGLKSICEEKLTKAVTDSIVITLELNEWDQELNLLKIVPKESHMKPEIITTTTSVRKALLGDRVYGTSDE